MQAIPLNGSKAFGEQAPHGQRPRTQVDFWDVGDPNFIGHHLPPDHGFSELVEVDRFDSRARILLAVLGCIVAGAVGYLCYLYYFEGVDPFEEVMAFFDQGGDIHSDETMDDLLTDTEPAEVLPLAPEPKVSTVVPGNPYWSLPNKLSANAAPLGRLWSPGEEETWRLGINHKFAYQRFKTIQEIRESRLRGSDVIFWEGLTDKKFWMRMWSTVGLAEFGHEVTLKTVEDALGSARSELVANYFKRFNRRTSPGERYVLRQAVKLLDERGRIVVLTALARTPDEFTDLYMTAATQDPGLKVGRWIEEHLFLHPIPPERYNRLLKVVLGESVSNYSTGLTSKPSEDLIDEPIMVEGDLPEFTEGFGGDVEFYQDGPAGEEDSGFFDMDGFEESF